MQPLPEPGWHVVVPVKGGRAAKSRLRRSLDDGRLVAAVAHDTLDVTAQVVGTTHVVVVTAEPDETAYARAAGHVVVPDPGTGLNAACAAGVAVAHASGALRVAVLLGDHPGLTRSELVTALQGGADHETFFVPDHEGTGTALVGATTGRAPELAFGPGSAARHAELGHARLELDAPGLRHDVDDEDSLRWATTHLTLGPRTRAALER